jgi:hypothetical protein
VATSAVNALPIERYRWDELEGAPPVGERLTVRSAAPGRRSDVLIAVDASANRFVLVEIPVGEPRELLERTSRGIAVQVVEMLVEDRQLRSFVEIACLERHGHVALDVVIGELVEALEAGASIGTVRLVQNVLAKWRRFWAGVSQGQLSKPEQIGLFGELWFLSRWLMPSVEPNLALGMWRGPMGARNDFECLGLAIEVKTSSRVDGLHVIHGIEQLLPPDGGMLYLFSASVREEASANDSLSTLVREIRDLLSADFDALGRFETLIYAARYEDAHAIEYSKLKLRVRAQELYRVAAGFPRLVPESLVGGVPAGVGSISYELSLAAAQSSLIATTPGAASTLLQDFVK